FVDDERVAALAADQSVGTGTADQGVLALPATDHVVTVKPADGVAAPAALEHVGAVVAVDRVAILRADGVLDIRARVVVMAEGVADDSRVDAVVGDLARHERDGELAVDGVRLEAGEV